MSYDTLIMEETAGVVTLTLNRPAKLNALNEVMATELIDAVSRVTAGGTARVLVITGAGKAFSAGADVKEVFGHWYSEGGEKLDWLVMGDWAEKACLALAGVEVPVVAAINGAAVGFGCTLALACDIRVASEIATLGLVFSKVGYMPEFGSTFFLPRIVGLGKASLLVFTGQILAAREALEIGLVDRVFPEGEFAVATGELLSCIAAQAPTTLRLAKGAMRKGLNSTLAEQLDAEKLATRVAVRAGDFREGVAAFLEKRTPTFKGN